MAKLKILGYKGAYEIKEWCNEEIEKQHRTLEQAETLSEINKAQGYIHACQRLIKEMEETAATVDRLPWSRTDPDRGCSRRH